MRQIAAIAKALSRGQVLRGKTRGRKEPFTVGRYFPAVGTPSWAVIVDPHMRVIAHYPDAFEAARAAAYLVWAGAEQFAQNERYTDFPAFLESLLAEREAKSRTQLEDRGYL